MEAIIERCVGLDVHEKTVVACALRGKLDGKPESEIETFDTTTKGLLKLLDWIEKRQCTHVAMESTGVYWKPVWNVLESGEFEMILANARHIKNLPGRKTDIKDAEWIAQLLRSGLVNKSYVPEQQVRDLRDLTRYRKKIKHELNREMNRVHKVLEDCNIKLSSYLSDIFGVTGRKLLIKIMNEEKITMSDLVEISTGKGKHKIREKLEDIKEALNGTVRKHHIRMIKHSYDHIVFLEEQILEVEKEIEEYIQPFREEIEILDSIPGINETAATVIVAEIGTDMSYFPSDKHIASWAGLSPGNNESAGKKRKVKSRDGDKALKSVMCECSWAASFSKDTRFSICYKRWIKKMGKKKATIALANLLLRICYNLLKEHKMYIEYGSSYLDELNKKKEENMIRILKSKGYSIERAVV